MEQRKRLIVEPFEDDALPDEAESGTLYIKGERDNLTGEKTRYYKVGIVRGQKDATTRDKALKTGNPRRITNLYDIESPFVQKLETRLHNEHAFARVSSGEWFDDERFSVDAMTAVAKELAEELKAVAPLLVRSAQIKGPGEGPLQEPSPRILELQADFTRASAERLALAKRRSAVNAELGKRAEGENDLYARYFKESRIEEKRSFSAVELKKKYPDLHREFSRKGEGKYSHKIVLSEKVEDASETFSGVIAEEDLGELSVTPELLHHHSLKLWGLIAERDWQIMILQARLLCEAAGFEGVRDVLTWSYSERNTFDKESFAAEHPELFVEFTSLSPGKTSYSVAEWAAYRGS